MRFSATLTAPYLFATRLLRRHKGVTGSRGDGEHVSALRRGHCLVLYKLFALKLTYFSQIFHLISAERISWHSMMPTSFRNAATEWRAAAATETR